MRLARSRSFKLMLVVSLGCGSRAAVTVMRRELRWMRQNLDRSGFARRVPAAHFDQYGCALNAPTLLLRIGLELVQGDHSNSRSAWQSRTEIRVIYRNQDGRLLMAARGS
jgi:hypothetical protein